DEVRGLSFHAPPQFVKDLAASEHLRRARRRYLLRREPDGNHPVVAAGSRRWLHVRRAEAQILRALLVEVRTEAWTCVGTGLVAVGGVVDGDRHRLLPASLPHGGSPIRAGIAAGNQAPVCEGAHTSPSTWHRAKPR